jgi:hypothetical protein
MTKLYFIQAQWHLNQMTNLLTLYHQTEIWVKILNGDLALSFNSSIQCMDFQHVKTWLHAKLSSHETWLMKVIPVFNYVIKYYATKAYGGVEV